MTPDKFTPADAPPDYRSPSTECQFALAWARLAAARDSATGTRRVTVIKPVVLAGSVTGR